MASRNRVKNFSNFICFYLILSILCLYIHLTQQINSYIVLKQYISHCKLFNCRIVNEAKVDNFFLDHILGHFSGVIQENHCEFAKINLFK